MFSNGLTTGALAVLLAGSQLASAHMEISFPPPFRSKFNPNAVNVDYTNTAPLAASGANYPCKGYHSDLGSAAGKSTATFAPGGNYNFTVVGGAPHGGGSCQVSLSYDKGKTFTVIQSIIGGCPLSSNYPFTIPSDAPAGEAIWAWTWSNQIGNREQYMNCAPVTIGGGGAKREVEEPKVEERATAAFSSRPQIFLANIGNGCSTSEGTDVDFPNPGPDVVRSGSNFGKPIGSCGAGAGSGAGAGAGNGAGSGSAPSSSAVQATVAPTPAPSPSAPVQLPGGVFVTLPASSAAAPAPTPTVAPTPTTLVSSVKAPAATGTTGSGSGSGTVNNSLAKTPGSACTAEGNWNCVNGTSWQRCASGTWSVIQPTAPGTVCTAGEGPELVVVKAGPKIRRSGKVRLSA
ncbi:hypothetical protein NEMBOFW57_004485 [Staphylotrichum longicolle]|uniref:Extracellular protein n=1 Tax=Staphylotrichum longicolle TaxID=669026 RepID=A0AAD4F823_9PEZI|nr:hypothetical protein NEMBOFW57_004485 [Staphylotrichum longicolle]